MPSIKDPEVRILATYSLTLQSDYPNEGELRLARESIQLD